MAMGTVPRAQISKNKSGFKNRNQLIQKVLLLNKSLTYHPSQPLRSSSPHFLCGSRQRRTPQKYWLQALFQDSINQVTQNWDLQM